MGDLAFQCQTRAGQCGNHILDAKLDATLRPRYLARQIVMVKPEAKPLPERFSTLDPDASELTEDVLTTAYIDTGENGIFSLEEFALLTTAEQMEFVTPEEIAQYLVYEIVGLRLP